MRDWQAELWLELLDQAGYQAEPFDSSILFTALKEELQAEADAEEWLVGLQGQILATSAGQESCRECVSSTRSWVQLTWT